MTSISSAEAYRALSSDDLESPSKLMSTGAKASWMSTFLKKHLPQNRLKANEDNLSAKYESVDGHHKKKKKKKGTSRASLSQGRNLPKRRWMFKANDNVKYSAYQPLKDMWTKYMEELIDFSSLTTSNLSTAALKMMKADLHGCPLSVRRSRCPSYVGLCGIVVQETRNMFVLVTPDDQVKRLPKANSVFTIALQGHVFTIHGSQFRVKPGDRAARKFKSKPSIDL